MNYTLHQLRLFEKVARTLSITRTAEELHLTQPAVSIQLRNFQDQFDLPLLEQIGKKIYITDFGKEIALAASRVLAEVHAIENRAEAYKGQLTGNLKFSVVSTGKYIAPYFITDFVNRHPAVELFMDVTNKAQVVNGLDKNEVDFSFVSVLPEKMNIDKVELMQNKLFVIGNHDASFGKKEYDKQIFKDMPLIYREAGSGTRHVMEKFIRKYGLPVKRKMELTSNEAVKQAVIAGLGFSIMPLIGIRNELENGQLRIIRVKGFPISSRWYMIWLKKKKLSPVAEAFLRYIREEKQRIIHDKFDWYERY